MIVLTLPFPPSTNGLFVNGQKGRFRSQKYDSWIMEAGTEINRQRPPKALGPVSLTFEYQEPKTKIKWDISNRLKSVEDLLVKHGVIEADDYTIVTKITAFINREVEGVRITIEPLFNRVSEASPGQTNERIYRR